uniref:Uncharacterized protein n=1 Tax=Lepeophtheirus salmonis TaxID=72036 RepID=A0A0K2VBL9_LEPSM
MGSFQCWCQKLPLYKLF